MAQTLPNGVVVPNANGGEQISETGVAEMRTLGASVDNALARLSADIGTAWARGRITDPVTLTDLDPGVYTVSSVQYAEMVTGIPEAHPSTIVVEGNAGQAVRAWLVFPHDANYFYSMRAGSGGTTTGWIKHTDSLQKGRITSETDAFTLEPGIYTVSSVAYAGMVANLPEVYPGTLEIIGNPGQGLKVARYYPYLKEYSYETVSANLSNGFMPWRKIAAGGAGTGDVPGVSPYAQHSFRQTQLLTAMGGPVYTGGLGAVAWRIDHGLKNFRDIMLPIFRAAGIVPMITYNPRDWSRPENEGVTAADLNQWVANGWVEISNHAANHTSATGNEAIYDQIVNGLAEIEAELPAAKGKVFGFCVAGSGGYTDDDGQVFTNGATPEQWGSYAGRLILEHHAVGYGYLPGTDLRVLDGTPRDGLSHLGTDTRPVSEFTAKIDQAIAERKGLQIMSHPSNLGNAGYHDAASIQQIVDYIVAKRDAGELAVLSSYQMMVADSTRASASCPSGTGWLDVIPSGSAVDPAEPGVVQFRRVGDQVFCRVVGTAILPGASNAWLLPNGIPPGYRLGGVGQVMDVPGGYGNGALQPNRAVRHRLSIQEDDIAYVGYIHNWNGVTVEAARDDGSRRIYGTIPPWITDDPFPA